MKKVGIIYFSETDITSALADGIFEGVVEVKDVNAEKYRIFGRDIIQGRYTNEDVLKALSKCQSLIFGSPTYMGGPSAQFKAFADATSEIWCEQGWEDKIAAGFTCGSSLNGDQGSTLQYFVTLANQHGMVWLGLNAANGYKDRGVNRLGCQLGVSAWSPDGIANEVDVATAKYLGRRVAKVVSNLTNLLT